MTGLLDALLGTDASGLLGGLLGGKSGLLGGLLGGNGTGLLGGLLGTAPGAGGAQDSVGGLFNVLTTNTARGTGSVATSSGSVDLLSLVTQLLPTVAKSTGSPAPAALPPLAAACTRTLSGTLPLLAGLR